MNNEDAKQLDLLALFHYVVGGIMAFLSCIPFVHVFVGLAIALGRFGGTSESSSASEDALFGWIFVIMGSLFILVGWAVSICIILAGRKLKQRRRRMFCMAVAGVECMFMPFGTVLGVFTLIVLSRDSVKAIYAHAEQERPVPKTADL